MNVVEKYEMKKDYEGKTINDRITGAMREDEVASDYWKKAAIKQLLSTFSLQDLINEICKREGVTSYTCPKENEYEVKIFEADGDGEWGYGRATILVVK